MKDKKIQNTKIITFVRQILENGALVGIWFKKLNQINPN